MCIRDRPDVWIKEAFTKDAAQTVLEDTKEVINNPHSTGYAACRTDITLAGKTGTAEIKASKEDTTGTELGWFSVLDVYKRQIIHHICMKSNKKLFR